MFQLRYVNENRRVFLKERSSKKRASRRLMFVTQQQSHQARNVKMPSADASPPPPASRLTLDYVRQFDSLALPDSDDMFLQIVPKRSNTPIKGESPPRGD